MRKHEISSVDNQEQGARQIFDKEHENVLQGVKTLTALFPICVNCKKIRDSNGNWQDQLECFGNHFKGNYTHTICPACAKMLYPELFRGRH
jgi:hypothetical protein